MKFPPDYGSFCELNTFLSFYKSMQSSYKSMQSSYKSMQGIKQELGRIKQVLERITIEDLYENIRVLGVKDPAYYLDSKSQLYKGATFQFAFTELEFAIDFAKSMCRSWAYDRDEIPLGWMIEVGLPCMPIRSATDMREHLVFALDQSRNRNSCLIVEGDDLGKPVRRGDRQLLQNGWRVAKRNSWISLPSPENWPATWGECELRIMQLIDALPKESNGAGDQFPEKCKPEDVPKEFRVDGAADGEPLTPDMVDQHFGISSSELTRLYQKRRLTKRIKVGRAYAYNRTELLDIEGTN